MNPIINKTIYSICSLITFSQFMKLEFYFFEEGRHRRIGIKIFTYGIKVISKIHGVRPISRNLFIARTIDNNPNNNNNKVVKK